MIAVFVNCGAIILGSIIGILFSKKISTAMEDIIQTAAGIVTVILGIQMAFKYQNVIYLALALIIGGIIGTALDIDGQILKLGIAIGNKVKGKSVKVKVEEGKVEEGKVEEGGRDKVKGKSEKVKVEDGNGIGNNKNFAYAFLNASVLFCVGAMAILGSLKAGIDHDYTIIFTKSVLDGFMAISFAAAMGVGTAFSALSILVYQGALTLLSTVVQPYCTEQMIAELTGSGGAIIIMIGINLIGLKKIKTANYLPALVLTIIFVLLDPYITKLIHF
jgi:uncharacterized membrane protein YqgA involved in biofilm formation